MSLKDETNCEFFVPRLSLLKELLEQYEFGQAARVQELIRLCPEDPRRFLYRVSSSEIWGSAGSVWDVTFSGNRPRADPEATKADDKRYLQVLLEIAEEAVRLGNPGGAASKAAAILSKWRSKGLI